MKKNFLKFPAQRVSYLPKINSRRMQLREFTNVAYKSDGKDDTEGDDAEAKKQLLEEIQSKVKTELDTRNYAKADDVSKVVAEQLKGLNLEALRKFDATKMDETVIKLAAELEKIKNAPNQQRNGESLKAIKAMLETKEVMDAIEMNFRAKDSTRPPVVLSTRAAVPVMTTGNVVLDGDIPEDILNSFSVDAFIKKRRPNEFIFDIADRVTVQDITEYKTWMEEGDEQGAFAIVTEGAVKPLVSKTLVRNVTKYQKIAGKRVYTEEFAKFRKEAYRIIEQLFNDQLVRNYAAILVTKLDTAAASYAGTVLDGQYDTPTDYHAVGAVAAQMEALNFNPDVLIINPQDKWRIALDQSSQGTFYVNIPMINPSTGLTMMGFNVVTSNRVAVGTAYLGEAGLYKIEDEPVTVRLGYGINVTKDVNGFVTNVDSDVDTNRFRIIAETYFHAYIGSNNLGSFVKFNFNTVKLALKAA